jgi:signal transduction histidine kinase
MSFMQTQISRAHLNIQQVTPLLTIMIALSLGFILFASTDLIEQWLLQPNLPHGIRFLHLFRGFIAAAGGMICVWSVMTKKEKEINRLRLNEQQRLHRLLMQHREDFLAAINHRLRNPILASERACKLLLDGDFGKLADQQSEIIHLISESTKEIDRCMTMLMDVYKYRNGTKTLAFSSIELSTMVEEICSTVQRNSRRKIIVQTGTKARVNGDEDEIRTLLYHIIENASKYGRSSVTVSVETLEAATVQISIRDDGAGITAEDADQIFERFFVTSSDGSYAAVTGIGLCLCSEIAKAHGGSITCRSELGVGTTMTFELPLSESK